MFTKHKWNIYSCVENIVGMFCFFAFAGPWSRKASPPSLQFLPHQPCLVWEENSFLIIGHDWESVTWLGAAGGIRHQLEGVAVAGNCREISHWLAPRHPASWYIYNHMAHYYTLLWVKIWSRARGDQEHFISVKNKGFLAGDRLKW